MLVLRTLGGLDVHLDGDPPRPVHLQPKRLALLIYLAIESREGPVPRDRLMSIFWPETGESAAHSALRQALHYLGRRLGPGLVRGAGEAEIELDPSRFRCDALEVHAALDAGWLVTAVGIYGGGFLDGFRYQAPSREFEQWVDREREHLRRRVLAAAIELADRSENSTARDWLQRARELAPYDEGLLRRLLRLLWQGGHRAEAIEAYRSFAESMEEDYGLTPEGKTRDVVERIESDQPWSKPGAAQATAEPLVALLLAEAERAAALVRQLQARVRELEERKEGRQPADSSSC